MIKKVLYYLCKTEKRIIILNYIFFKSGPTYKWSIHSTKRHKECYHS